MENWIHAARYLHQHRYTAQNPRREVINGFEIHIAQDVDDTWKWRDAPFGMWSEPYSTFESAYQAAALAAAGE